MPNPAHAPDPAVSTNLHTKRHWRGAVEMEYQTHKVLNRKFPYHYKITQRSRYEDADGLVIIDLGHEKERGGVLCRYWDVEFGTNCSNVPLDRPEPLRARLLAAESAERERREKAWLAAGFFQRKTFTLINRTDSLADQGDLFHLQERERFHDGYWTRARGRSRTSSASRRPPTIW